MPSGKWPYRLVQGARCGSAVEQFPGAHEALGSILSVEAGVLINGREREGECGERSRGGLG